MVADFKYGPKLKFDENRLTESTENSSKKKTNLSVSDDSSGSASDDWVKHNYKRGHKFFVKSKAAEYATASLPWEPQKFLSLEQKIITRYNRKLHARTDTSETERTVSSSRDSSKYTFSAHSLGNHWRRVADSSRTTSPSSTKSPFSENLDNETRNMYAIQEENLSEILEAVRVKKNGYNVMLNDADKKFHLMQDEANNIWQMFVEKHNDLENNQDSFESDVVQDVENMIDFSRECIEVIANKDRIDGFLSRAEHIMHQTSKTAMTIAVNTKKVENIRKMLDFIAFDQGPLTVFEHEDYRYHQVLASFPNWIKMLPFNGDEKVEIERLLLKAQQNPQYTEKYKIEKLFSKVIGIMNNWNKTAQSESDANDTWHSLSSKVDNPASSSFRMTGGSMYKRSELSSAGNVNYDENFSDAFKSSSFALTDDSNLNDLNQELADAKIRRAVEGPNNCYEASSWSSASNFTSWTDVTNGMTSIQSLREPMTLSSYEMKSSAEPSLSDTSDKFSFQDAEIRTALTQDDELRTALSNDDIVSKKPPRSTNPLQPDEQIEEFEGSKNSDVPSYSVGSLTIPEMLDEALHTAIEAVEKESHDLYNSLRDSANKCGVAMNNLLGSASSSESKSSTLSHNETHH